MIENTGALRGKPRNNNLCGVVAAGIAVRGCVGRPLSLEIGACPSCRLVLLWSQEGGCRNNYYDCAVSYGRLRPLSLYSELYRMVTSGSDTDTSCSLYCVITNSLTSIFFVILYVVYVKDRGERKAVCLIHLPACHKLEGKSTHKT